MRKMGIVRSISNFLERKKMNVCSTVKNNMHVMTVRVKLITDGYGSFIAGSKEKGEKPGCKNQSSPFL